MLIIEAVAYQFAKIGNDGDGQSLVQDLDDDKKLGEYIDSMGTPSGHDCHQLFVYATY